MAITQRAAGTWGIVTTDATVTIPAGTTSGDMMLLFGVWKPFGVTALVPGWTEILEEADGAVADGANVGSVKVGVWYKEHTGSESNPSLDFSAGVIGASVIVSFQKGALELWSTPVADGVAIASATNFVTNSATLTPAAGDAVVLLVGIRDDTALMTRATDAIQASTGSITWAGNYTEFPGTHASTTTGNDIAADAGYRIVNTGTGTDLFGTGTLSAAETGMAGFVVLRVTTPVADFIPQQDRMQQFIAQ